VNKKQRKRKQKQSHNHAQNAATNGRIVGKQEGAIVNQTNKPDKANNEPRNLVVPSWKVRCGKWSRRNSPIIVAGFTGILALIGAFQIFIYRTQLEINRTQLEINRAQLEINRNQLDVTRKDLRAWMNERSPNFGKVKFVEGQPLNTSITFFDTGKTPAKQVFARSVLRVVRNSETPITFDFNVSNNSETGIIFPTESDESPVGTLIGGLQGAAPLALSHDDYVALKDKRAFLILYSRLEYVDTFGVKHFVQRCMWRPFSLTEKGNYESRQCPHYNETDDN
jgi:hypothetical protein